jgi:voltage-gated potassium channel
MPVENISRLKKQLLFLVVSLFATFFIAAGIALFVQDLVDEAFTEDLRFDESIYFITTTVTSIGYGDIYPKTLLSRLVTVILLLSVFTVFGNQITKIVNIMKEQDEFDVNYNLNDHAIVFAANSQDML